MSTYLQLLVPRMERAKIDSGVLFVDNGSGGYGYEVLSRNPNGYAEALNQSTTLKIQLDADLTGSLAYNISAAGIYLRNCDLFNNVGTVTIKSTTHSDYSSLSTRGSAIAIGLYGASRPLNIVTFSDTTDKYWEIIVDSGGALRPRIAMAFVLTVHQITCERQYHDLKSPTFDVDRQPVGGGRDMVRLGSTMQRLRSSRRYLMTDSQIAVLRSAFAAAYGSAVPIILNDRTDGTGLVANQTGYLVRFAQDTLGEIPLGPNLWDVTVNFEELPQIAFGRGY